MSDPPTTVLLVEDDRADAGLIQGALSGSGDSVFRVEWVTRLSNALERLAGRDIEVVERACRIVLPARCALARSVTLTVKLASGTHLKEGQ